MHTIYRMAVVVSHRVATVAIHAADCGVPARPYRAHHCQQKVRVRGRLLVCTKLLEQLRLTDVLYFLGHIALHIRRLEQPVVLKNRNI